MGKKKIRVNLHELGLGNDFKHITPKAQTTAKPTDKWHFTKIFNFCTSRNTIQESEKILHKMAEGWGRDGGEVGNGRNIANLKGDLCPDYIKNSYDLKFSLKKNLIQFKNA